MKRILITGCAGYIGSVLTTQLVNKGYNVDGIDNLMYNNIHSIVHLLDNPTFNFCNGNVTNYNLLDYYLDRCDVIIPLAAIVGGPACDKNKEIALEINQHSIEYIANNLSNKQRIIFPNTNSGYGNKLYVCDEDTSVNPISLYGKTKQNAEEAILQHPNAVSLRLATVCGISPRMRFDLLVNDFTAKIFYDEEIHIYEPTYMRNYIHIKDVVNAFIFMIENEHIGVFNLGNPDANLSKFELAVKICNLRRINPNEIIKIEQGKDPDQRNYVISNDKILNTGFKFEYTIEDAIKKVIKLCRLYPKEEIKRMNNL